MIQNEFSDADYSGSFRFSVRILLLIKGIKPDIHCCCDQEQGDVLWKSISQAVALNTDAIHSW